MVGKLPRFIYITGCDGTGKTTQARLLIDRLSAQGVKPKHVWLRFPFLTSIPLLAYARWRRYSWYEVTNGVRHGFWDFRPSWLMRTFLPWFLLFDATLSAIVKIYLPLLLGQTLVCERFVLDMLADMMVAFGSQSFFLRYPGNLFLKLIPPNAKIAILNLDEKTIRQRRGDLQSDWRLEDRLEVYHLISSHYSFPIYSSTLPPNELNDLLYQQLTLENE